MTSAISKKLGYTVAQQFKEGFYEPSPSIGYVYIGNHLVYPNENNPPSITDSIADEKTVWDNMIAAKKITGTDVELVIPRVNWTANTRYKEYDDVVSVSDLITGNASINVKPMYVVTTSRNVYKCLSNNASANSTVEPTGDYTTSNGNITTSDGYIWKYMYNVKPSNKFLTDTWIPVPSSVNQLDYSSSVIDVVPGEITTIVVSNTGFGYYENNVSVPFIYLTGCSVITLANTTNVSANMSISGVGIVPGTFINSVDIPNNQITLSSSTIAPGGAGTTANQLALQSRVYVDGDGTTLSGLATLHANGQLAKITVSTIGIGYSRANAYVFGTGTGGVVRPILDPKFGHAYNPARELGCSDVMVAIRLGEIDSTENGKISANTTFRQYGILVDPHKYGDANVVSSTNAASIISQTTDIQLVAGSPYALDEFVYQGTAVNSAFAYGFVVDQSSNILRVTNVRGRFAQGAPLIGANTGISRLIINTSNPEFEPYSGDILYTENATKTTRADGQAESIKLIVKF
jgi:hypothetical protein